MIDLVADRLQEIVGCTHERAAEFAWPIGEACAAFDIAMPPRIAAFLANVGHECRDFEALVESFNYRADRLVAVFGAHRITPDQAARFGRTEEQPALQEAIANTVYDGVWGRVHLGNVERGDGWVYRGRGCIQTTGRSNYRALKKILEDKGYADVPDFEAAPDRLIEPRWAAAAAGAFWDHHNLNRLADLGDFHGIVKTINGGTNGMEDRIARWRRATNALAT